ncbi:hypothetical protein DPMN_105232 [Dreissena polymorpha]|uniref:Uncharacterized protein n=1 Tax=Dreissena polymorpha TaxID=45954 RepID=A0A9D4HEG5_DREPO|nr:hypothetical protein DPMN_105232 [Dreissena polymorpha]
MNNKWPPGGHIVKNVSSRLFTCFHYIHIEKTAPPLGSHVFPPIMTIFKLIRDIYKINAKNVTSRVFTSFFNYINIRKMTPPPLVAMFFSQIQTIFELNRHIQKTHGLTKFHEEWAKNVTFRVFTCFHYIHIEKTAPPPGSHFHDDWAKIVTSRVFTRFLYSHIWNSAPPPGGHLHEDWASNVTSTVFKSFELSIGINGTNVLTKFHEDRK